MKQKKSSHMGAIATGIAGLTAAAVGAYYLYGSDDAKKNRAKVKSWMLKAKGEVMEELEKAADITEAGYISAVDAVAKKYNELKQVDPAELEAFISDMKDHWDGIQKSVVKVAKATKKTTAAKSPKSSKK